MPKTYGELYRPAMQIRDQAGADAYLEILIAHHLEHSSATREEAERIERENLAYYAGYYDNETRERIERLFKCEHPVFGSIAKRGAPDPMAAFTAGKLFGAAMRKERDES